jgi:hypothetical protein
MSKISSRYWVLLALVGLLTLGGVRMTKVYAIQAPQRPLSDFLSKQGTTMVFNTPVPDQIGWFNNSPGQFPPASARFALFDYAGLAADYLNQNFGISLGTTTSGSVTERPLADGRAEVTVILHTTNALAWVSSTAPNPDPNQNPVLFGYKAAEIAMDPSKEPALGESHLKVVFKNPTQGADLPDLVNAFILGNAAPGQELVSISFLAQARGSLRTSANLGPEGTLGECFVAQNGILFNGPFMGATTDGFPAELVELHRIGQ